MQINYARSEWIIYSRNGRWERVRTRKSRRILKIILDSEAMYIDIGGRGISP